MGEIALQKYEPTVALDMKEQEKPVNSYLLLALVCIAVGFILIYLLFNNEPPNLSHINVRKQVVDSSSEAIKDYHAFNGTIGDFIGGTVGTLFSLAGFFLLYLTFRTQAETLKGQQDALNTQELQFQKERIESRFFELVKLHRSNVEELVQRDWKTGVEIANGRRVFKEIFNQIEYCIEINTLIFGKIEPSALLNKEVFEKLANHDREYVRQYCIITLSFSIVFFGVAKESFNGLSNSLKNDFSKEFIKDVYEFYRLIPVAKSKYWPKWDTFYNNKYLRGSLVDCFFNKENFKKLDETFQFGYDELRQTSITKDFFKFFGGHQSKLGHYYRHLFQTVKYIDKQLIPFDDKYDYVKTLRAQLSNYEQYLFFLNSIAYMGREWEVKHTTEYNKLITKFNLIKNIPFTKYNYKIENVEYCIDFQKFYPLVHFEFEKVPFDRECFIERVRKCDWDKIIN